MPHLYQKYFIILFYMKTNEKLNVYKMPDNFIAYPTILIFLLGYSIIITSIILRVVYKYSFYYTIPLSILGTYSLFPVIHDGSHRTISNIKLYNEVLSYLAGIPFFFAPFPTWRFIHLRHHQFTNIPAKDPDYYAGGGVKNKMVLPLRWVTHVIHYYIYVIRELYNKIYYSITKKLLKDNSYELNNFKNITLDRNIQSGVKIFTLTIAAILINIFMAFYAFKNNFFNDLAVLWIIPSALTIIMLTFLFDYLPHRDYETDIRESKYKSTNMTHGLFKTSGKINNCISLLTCNQLTYHNIHHLYPRMPFYKYPEIWEKERERLIELGTNVQSIF